MDNVEEPHESLPRRKRTRVPLVIGTSVLGLLAVGAVMVVHAESQTNKVALGKTARPVTVVEAKASTYRASRTYVGTIEPWIEANVGPQRVSAYVDTVLVRPGTEVKKGDVLATLDCKSASATRQAVGMQARALDARQKALSHEASRVEGLLDGGFVSPNEAEQKNAQSAAEEAQLLAAQAKLLGTSLDVNDCILRSPFDGEVATRTVDPGAFVRPGTPLVSVVDRTTVRVTADAPEVDFDVIAPNTNVTIHALATGQDFVAAVSRRAPRADASTRTIHFELDVPDPKRTIPVGTTGELHIDVGEPVPATEIPLYAASVRGAKASIFVVEAEVARARVVPIRGEIGGTLFLDVALLAGAHVVSEGRALLSDGDPVSATLAKEVPTPPPSPSALAPDSQGVKP